MRVSSLLPDFPWDTIAAVKQKAAAHPGGLVDLSVGTPVDPVDPLIQAALNSVAEVPGYPTTHGTPELGGPGGGGRGRGGGPCTRCAGPDSRCCCSPSSCAAADR